MYADIVKRFMHSVYLCPNQTHLRLTGDPGILSVGDPVFLLSASSSLTDPADDECLDNGWMFSRLIKEKQVYTKAGSPQGEVEPNQSSLSKPQPV